MTLLDQVEAMLEGIIKERVHEHVATEESLRFSICKQERDQAQRERDEARQELAHVRQALRSETRVANAMAERDQARAELAGVAAQRDSWMAKSIALAEQLHALQPATPSAPVEVGGFRVGDLVSVHGCTPEPIARFVLGHAQLDDAGFAVAPDRLTRKRVEVGDTVRTTDGDDAAKGIVRSIWRVALSLSGSDEVDVDTGSRRYRAQFRNLVAVAP